jgi:D-alanine-D-alanine ligase
MGWVFGCWLSAGRHLRASNVLLASTPAAAAVAGRASQNVEFVETIAELPSMVASVGHKTNTLVLVERFLGGREFCIAVMGAGPAGAFAFSPVERCLERDEKVGKQFC